MVGVGGGGWGGVGVKSLLEIENIFDLFRIFRMFYHFNYRLALTNGLLVVPDGDTPEGFEKISLKYLCEMFQGTKSHGLVSVQFLCALDMFLGGNISLSKYQNQKQKKGAIKKASKKTPINYMKKANYLQTNNDKTVDYGNDTKPDDLSTVGYNSDADVNIIKPMTFEPKTGITQQQAKK